MISPRSEVFAAILLRSEGFGSNFTSCAYNHDFPSSRTIQTYSLLGDLCVCTTIHCCWAILADRLIKTTMATLVN
jgi:hypothetical protein